MLTQRIVQPSRVLNDQRGFLGLSMPDFAGAIVTFMVLSLILDGSAWALMSIPISLLLLFALSPIRLSTRRKIIRDFGISHLSQTVMYDPKKHA